VESEARIEDGVWGRLAAGTTLAELNERGGSAPTPRDESPPLLDVERWVGVLTPLAKGAEPAAIYDGALAYATNMQWHVPEWFTREFVRGVHGRLRALVGRWRATRFGERMELEWRCERG